ncbi:cyclic nucleotide-binding protein [Spirochaetia bacterium]|nr:cyclic nucleotide-binding protein [Spirochaetia bacterium]
MGTLGIVNSDPAIKQMIEVSVRSGAKAFLSEESDIFEFLNYELPGVLIINFSDPKIDIEKIANHIRTDKWALNFGIIGIFVPDQHDEESLFQKYNAINILTFMDTYRIHSHLNKGIEIIEENYQIIFQREFTKNLMDGVSGSFTIDNDIFALPLYAGIGATLPAQRGLVNPEHKMHLQLALGELLVNAVEHGNCGITYDEKTEGMDKGLSMVDLVAERCKNPVINARKVRLQWEIQTDQTIFIVQDDGDGFDVQAHLQKIARQDALSLHGRGIQMAAKLTNDLKYNLKGNKVTIVIRHDRSVENEIPQGFSREQVLMVKKGDMVMREGDPGDYLYYISSGEYNVYHDKKLVGTLSPQDIFMGEMSFLLNQTRSASIRAETDGKLILLTRKNFINVIRKYPHYGIFLSQMLTKRIIRGNERYTTLIDQFKRL